MENYFSSQRDNIFRNVEVLIYVFDVESREIDKDIHYYQSCLESMAIVIYFYCKFLKEKKKKTFVSLFKHSPKAKIFCLIHKMDLIPEVQRDLVRIIFY